MNQTQIKILGYGDAKAILQIFHQNFDNIIKQGLINVTLLMRGISFSDMLFKGKNIL